MDIVNHISSELTPKKIFLNLNQEIILLFFTLLKKETNKEHSFLKEMLFKEKEAVQQRRLQ